MKPLRTVPPEPPFPDPIVDEVRAIRAAISARFGHDPVKYLKYLQRKESYYVRKYGLKVVVPSAKPRARRRAKTAA